MKVALRRPMKGETLRMQYFKAALIFTKTNNHIKIHIEGLGKIISMTLSGIQPRGIS
jgi:hypothetical protein